MSPAPIGLLPGLGTRLVALLVGVVAGCFTGEGLLGQPCQVDADCNAVAAVSGPELACNDGSCGVVCGDGVIAGDERCDDGNDIDTDDCVACAVAVCGDGFTLAGSEACDDGNADDDDGCIACEVAICGDGVVRVGVEECDDGNKSNTPLAKHPESTAPSLPGPIRCLAGVLRSPPEPDRARFQWQRPMRRVFWQRDGNLSRANGAEKRCQCCQTRELRGGRARPPQAASP